jgi:hypothetical protein
MKGGSFMGKIDWDVVTNFTDAVTTTLKTVTFPKVQEQVYLRNQGNANFTYTIGSQSGTLTPGQSVTVNQDVSSFTLQAASGTHTFELRAKEKGTEFEEAPSDVPSQIASLTSSLAEKTPKIYVESYKRLGNESDDTARIQRAIDTAPEYAEIVFDPKVNYSWTSIISTKSLTINFNGANLTVNPYVTQTPAIWFKGSVGTSYPLTADVGDKGRTITVTGASTLFNKNDYVVVGDNHITTAWSGSATYTGRYEINMVASVSGDTITLLRPMEWLYTVADGAFVQKVTNMIKQPKIMNSGNIKEIDPGVASTNSPASPGKGHIFQFQYCLQPELENCDVDGWQMHVVNTNFCILATIKNVHVRLPFRPTEGGHGYMLRDDNSLGTVVEKCLALGARHMVDWSRSYDGISRDNISENQSGVSFYTHGTGVKRCMSINDQVLGANSAEEGWVMGDPAFNADYDYQIINPKYIGTSVAIVMRVGSQGMKVINPWILTRSTFAVSVSRGAKGFTMEGGQIENFNPGAGYYAVFVDITTGGSTPVEYPRDITIRGTKFKGNSKVFIDALGKVELDGLKFDDSVNITADGGQGAAIRVGSVQAPTDLVIKNCDIRGSFDRGIFTSVAPTGQYDIKDNRIGSGYRTGGVQIRSATNIRYERNTIVDNGVATAESFSSANTLSGDKQIGALFNDNTPGTNDNGIFTTSTRPSGKTGKERGFDSTLGKPVWLKTVGTKESATLQITAGATSDGNVTVTLSSNTFTVAVLTGDTAIQVADKIRARSYITSNWYAKGTTGTDTITFTSAVNGDRTGTFSYTGGTTGSTGTMTANNPVGTNDVWVDATGTTV